MCLRLSIKLASFPFYVVPDSNLLFYMHIISIQKLVAMCRKITVAQTSFCFQSQGDMLGISGQAKSISQRSVGVQKEKTKLPAISPAKVVVQKKKGSTKPKAIKPTKPARKATAEPQVDHTAQSVLEIAKLRLSLPIDTYGDTGIVKIRFNHYNKSFPIHNGVLVWADVDEEYCLSFVYRGSYTRNLALSSSSGIEDASSKTTEDLHDHVDGKRYAKHDEHFTYYINIADKSEYTLEVIEDPEAGIGAEGLRINAGPLKSDELKSIQTTKAIQSTSRAMDNITAELKSIAVTELNDSYAKDLIERRDLEDILFSS